MFTAETQREQSYSPLRPLCLCGNMFTESKAND
jgi:hypothetical protein